MRLLFLGFWAVLAGAAQAAPVTWVLNATLTNGSAVTGQFSFDANLGQFTDIDILVAVPGYEDQGVSYRDPSRNGDGTGVPTIYTQGYDYSEGYPVGFWSQLSFEFDQALTNAGGVIDLTSGYRVVNVQNPGSTDCYFLPYCLYSEQSLISGTVSAVPIPAAAWLFASALVGLGWLRRRTSAP